MEIHNTQQEQWNRFLPQSERVFGLLESNYNVVASQNWRPNQSNVEFLGDQDYWVRIHKLGGNDLEQYLRGIQSPCMTWSKGDPIVLFNTDTIPSDELNILMAEEFLHASGLRTPFQIPYWEAENSQASRVMGQSAMEKFTVYLACRSLGVLNYPFLPKDILPNLQAEVTHAAVLGRFLEVGDGFDLNMIAVMCITGNVEEFIAYYNEVYAHVEYEGGIDPATQLLTLAGLMYQYEVLPDGDPQIDMIGDQMGATLGVFLDAYSKI